MCFDIFAFGLSAVILNSLNLSFPQSPYFPSVSRRCFDRVNLIQDFYEDVGWCLVSNVSDTYPDTYLRIIKLIGKVMPSIMISILMDMFTIRKIVSQRF